jgi:hypothetical protein
MSNRSTLLSFALVAVLVAATCMFLASCGEGDSVTNVTNVTSTSIYGDGSAGARTVSADETLSDENFQYTNFTVEAGFTLTVPSGTVIRCTGTFTNDGTIVVLTGAEGGRQSGFSGGIDGTYAPPEPGVSKRGASNGEFGDNTITRAGGLGGIGLGAAEARSIVRPGIKAGGGAGGAFATDGSAGGGSLVIRARGGVVNSGAIRADGESAGNRSGGGGGGIIVIASDGAIANSGTISADGGDGRNNDGFAGIGGGGGGGIIHLLSTNVTAGTTSVAGGAAGANAGNVTSNPRQGGGGGGACGGGGGSGGSVSAANTANAASPGSAGYVLTTNASPAALFLSRSAAE